MVGVPDTVPVAASTDRPGGSPVADQLAIVAVGEESVTLARSDTAVPDTPTWAPGLVTATVLLSVQVNVAVPLKPALSLAVTVTLNEPAVVGEPLIAPEAEAMDTPAGRPVADQLKLGGGDVWLSVAESERLTPWPVTPDWFAGPVTVTVLRACQLNVACPVNPDGSLALTVTAYGASLGGRAQMRLSDRVDRQPRRQAGS